MRICIDSRIKRSFINPGPAELKKQYVDLYLNMVGMQFTYDALKIIGFDMEMMGAIEGEMKFMQKLAHEGKIAQGIFIAKKM